MGQPIVTRALVRVGPSEHASKLLIVQAVWVDRVAAKCVGKALALGGFSILALVGFRGDGGRSHDQSRDEGAKESFASASGIVHELEEAEIQRQLLLRDAPVWPQPGA